MKIKDVVRVFGMLGTLEDHLSDEDVVRVCLLLRIDRLFLGRDGPLPMANTLLQAVEDFQSWNQLPWGSYVWTATYNQMHRAIGKRVGDRRKKMMMTGFLFAFKVS